MVKQFLLPPSVKTHYVFNGKIISDEKYETLRHEFPDPGQAMQLHSEWEQKTEHGKYTHIYVHNDRNKPIELTPNTDVKYPNYEFE